MALKTENIQIQEWLEWCAQAYLDVVRGIPEEHRLDRENLIKQRDEAFERHRAAEKDLDAERIERKKLEIDLGFCRNSLNTQQTRAAHLEKQFEIWKHDPKVVDRLKAQRDDAIRERGAFKERVDLLVEQINSEKKGRVEIEQEYKRVKSDLQNLASELSNLRVERQRDLDQMARERRYVVESEKQRDLWMRQAERNGDLCEKWKQKARDLADQLLPLLKSKSKSKSIKAKKR